MATDTTIRKPHPFQEDAHERANAITHGVGFVLSAAATVAVISAARNAGGWVMAAAAAYGATLLAVYAFSTLSHAVRGERARNRLRAWDQGAIYFLIVGTYTPFIPVFLPPTLAGCLAAAMWIAAALGFYSKVVVNHRVNALATWSYLLLGWLPALAFIGRVPLEVFAWMAAGGVSYTLGVAFLKMDHRFAYCHAIWHVFVILASAIHFYCIYAIVLPA